MYKKSLVIIALMLFASIAPYVYAATYEFPLAKGTGESEVKVYDEDKWKDEVGSNTPDKVFGGDADKVGAKSKSTIKSWDDKKYDIWDLAYLLNDSWDEPYKKNFNIDFSDEDTQKVAESYSGYPSDTWEAWEVTRDHWDYTTKDFSSDPDDEDDKFPIFKDPKDADDILSAINKIPKIVMYVITYLNVFQTTNNATKADQAGEFQAASQAEYGLTSDDFFEIIILQKGLPVAKPVDDYINDLLDVLKPDKWKYNENKNILTGELKDKDDYIVKIEISDLGTASKISYYEDEDATEPFYEIQGSVAIPGYNILILLGIFGIFSIGLIYIVMKKKL
ncbi:MAG: hypothetical protein ACTSQP_06855 [Promethearchaeota archaeon]